MLFFALLKKNTKLEEIKALAGILPKFTNSTVAKQLEKFVINLINHEVKAVEIKKIIDKASKSDEDCITNNIIDEVLKVYPYEDPVELELSGKY
jgi:hypothetical protein